MGLLTAGALLLSACTGGEGGDGGGTNKADAPPVAKVSVEPGDGAKDLSPRAPVKVSVAEGSLDEVTLTADGKAVAGKIAADKKTWAPDKALEFGKSYTLGGSATGTDGKKVEIKGGFATQAAGKLMRATINPVDNATVGIAMPVKVEFDEAPQDRAAVEKALKVETSVPVEGAWAWLNPKEVHYRPKEFWPANTQVKVTADLFAVPYGKNVFGRASLSTKFTIGRAQIVEASVASKRMIVKRDGRELMNLPASLGDESKPDLRTANGIYMVSERNATERMVNEKYKYDVVKKWAVRIANSGEFIHENQDNAGNLGKRNTSHGCINLSEADAKKYFDSALIGDPVIISGSAGTKGAVSDTYDWRIDWPTWLSKSALK
ncbi:MULTISPECIES: Ig-like domain-containing protein [unclassified Crossiella]|uniref:L,D-transpeptidase n=1 Tax=unclassified Crossiella TaxID=2620835 RepID=UPI001FFEBD0A|nr:MULTISPECIES: Ig-like domain-containing protein [unclassified Crossiella]MCK2236687.1 Ig-like domain-containing protein [Crossiella sp. S99.2]MCK2250355.1 Ig-like domain-containing protein [Crossiella sp. S99.1]